MASTTSEPSGTDWAQLFEEIESSGKVPFAETQAIEGLVGTFRAMYLDLGAIASSVKGAAAPLALVQIYADVLNVPAGLVWPVSGSVLEIQARRIEAGEGAAVSIDLAKPGTLVLYTNEVAGTLIVTAGNSGEAPSFTQAIDAPPASGGLQVQVADGTATAAERSWSQGLPALGIPQTVTDYLATEFIFASLLWDERPDIALGIFAWVKNWSSASPALIGDFLRSASMVALLTQQTGAQANGATFVPYLTSTVYASLAQAYVAQAKGFEDHYLALSTVSTLTDADIQLAKTLLANQTAQGTYVTQLLKQAQSNYDSATAAVAEAKSRFVVARQQVEAAQIDFKDKGIPEWEREKIFEAVIGIVTAIVTFGVGIATMMAGDPAGGGASAEAGAAGAEAVEEAAAAGSEIAKTAGSLKKVMDQLTKMADALQKVYDLSNAVITASQNIQGAEKDAAAIQALDLSTSGIAIGDMAGWQIYQLNSDASLAGPISQGIEYADDLKLAIDAVVIYGQALAAAQVAAVQAGQRYAQVQLQLALAAEQQKNLQNHVDSLVAGEAATAGMMQLFYRRYIDIKSALFSALQYYRASYFYWALQPSSVSPRIVDPVATLGAGLADLTAIQLDDATALQSFPVPPQQLKQQLVRIADPAVLANLVASHKASFSIGLGEPAFGGFGRVRLSRIRVWLENTAATGSDYSINMKVSNSGAYQDRLGGTDYQFVAQPLVRAFEYQVTAHPQGGADWTFEPPPPGLSGKVQVDGALDALVSYAYFEPTPFAQWTIELVEPLPDLDLSTLRSITLEFSGSVVPTAGENAHRPGALADARPTESSAGVAVAPAL